MVQNHISGMVHSSGQVLNRAFAKLIYSENVVVDVGDAVDVVFKDVDAEGVMELCAKAEDMSGTVSRLKHISSPCPPTLKHNFWKNKN